MTENKNELIAAMSIRAAELAGLHCKASGYPQPTDEQTREMGRLWIRAFTAFADGFKPERDLTDEENEQIEAIIEGAARGAVDRVLGASPSAN